MFHLSGFRTLLTLLILPSKIALQFLARILDLSHSEIVWVLIMRMAIAYTAWWYWSFARTSWYYLRVIIYFFSYIFYSPDLLVSYTHYASRLASYKSLHLGSILIIIWSPPSLSYALKFQFYGRAYLLIVLLNCIPPR